MRVEVVFCNKCKAFCNNRGYSSHEIDGDMVHICSECKDIEEEIVKMLRCDGVINATLDSSSLDVKWE
jgi:hypothetical protein